jgi:hypothetical protein
MRRMTNGTWDPLNEGRFMFRKITRRKRNNPKIPVSERINK